MVCGAPGTGKSTFVNSLCEGRQVISRSDKDLNDYYSMELSEDVPLQIDTYSLEIWDRVNECKIALRIVDFPGFGYNMDNTATLHSIGQYLQKQFEKVMVEESKINRNPKLEDSTIHACIYFIESTGHGLRELDVQFMKQMTDKVNVIPVIGRADQLSKFELAYSKRLIMEDIRWHNISIYDFRLDDDDDYGDEVSIRPGSRQEEYQLHLPQHRSDAILPEVSGYSQMNEYEEHNLGYPVSGVPRATTTNESHFSPSDSRPLLPLALVCSTDVVNDRFVRQYPWGTIDIEDSEVSDFLYLKNALLVTHALDLKETTLVGLYEKYRRAKLRKGLSTSNGSPTLRNSFAFNKNQDQDDEVRTGLSDNNRMSVSSSTKSLVRELSTLPNIPSTPRNDSAEKVLGGIEADIEQEMQQKRANNALREKELLKMERMIVANSNRRSVPPPLPESRDSFSGHHYGYSPRSQSFAEPLTSRAHFNAGGSNRDYTTVPPRPRPPPPPPIAVPPAATSAGVHPTIPPLHMNRR